MTQRRPKRENPLYVVTNQGKDVESASGLFDAMIKRLGVAPIVYLLGDIFYEILKALLNQVNSYPLLVAAQEILSKLIQQLEELMARLGLGPVVETR